MQARLQTLFGTVGLTAAVVSSAWGQAAVVRAPGGSATYTLTVTVPSVVRVSIVDGRSTPDGAPLLQVKTNDPGVRRLVANGIKPEELQALSIRFNGAGHSKGGELALDGQAEVTTPVIRYTIVRP